MVPKFTETRGLPTRSFALVGNAGTGGREYAVFMHPIRATRDDVGWARYSLRQVREAYSDYVANKGKRNKGSMGLEAATYKMGKKLAILGGHLEQCNVVHISYQGIYTGFGYGRQWAPFGRLRNTWAEPWGKVFKWQSFGATLFYEFFLRDVTSQAYLSQCLSNVQSWFDTHPL